MSFLGNLFKKDEVNNGNEVTTAEQTQPVAEGMKSQAMQEDVNRVISHLMHPKEQSETEEKSNEIDPTKTADPTELSSDKQVSEQNTK